MVDAIAVAALPHIFLRMRRMGLPSLLTPPLQGMLTNLMCVDEVIGKGDTFSQELQQCAIQTTVSGQAEVTVNGKRLRHRPGNLFVIARGVSLREQATTVWRLRYVMLDGPWCGPLISVLAESDGALMFDRPPRSWLAALDAIVEGGISGKPESGWLIASALATILGGLTGHASGKEDLVSHIGRLVDAAPHRSWNVPTLARMLHMPQRTLQLRFHTLTGSGPAQWILHRRMAHARVHLQRGVSVQDTSERMGFANQFHFSRAFKRCTGTPPSVLLA